MPDYKKMYYKLFRAHAKVIAILERAEKETEEMYMDSKEPFEWPDCSNNKPDKDRKS